MKIEIDFNKKEIVIKEKASVTELLDFIDKLEDKEEWTIVSSDTTFTIYPSNPLPYDPYVSPYNPSVPNIMYTTNNNTK